MALSFSVAKNISPSGVNLAYIDIPALDPEENISLLDLSYKWPENTGSIEATVISSNVGQGGYMPSMTINDFVVTNITTKATNDKSAVPLYYSHICRFYHYSYGDNPSKSIYITDQLGNVLKDINYKVLIERYSKNIYKVLVLTDFKNSKYVQYLVKYNRCYEDGTNISPSWTELLNPKPLFKAGIPLSNIYEYSIAGPTNGTYNCIVPPVPALTELVNGVGISFERAPTIIRHDVSDLSEYGDGVTVTYTLTATSPTTYTIDRDVDMQGEDTEDIYLQSVSDNIWGVGAVNFFIGAEITGIPGVNVKVHGDHYLITNDTTSFTAKKSFYYLKPIAYRSIYAKKPTNVNARDSWYLSIKNGTFRRRMDDAGAPVPSGTGTEFEYKIPEYAGQLFDETYGSPRKRIQTERVDILDYNKIQLKHTPIYINPSSVLYNDVDPGFPPSGDLTITVNNDSLASSQILDWDIYNGVIKIDRTLGFTDDVIAGYIYEDNFYTYTGFVGSGGVYPEVSPLPFIHLDLNPTEAHNYGMFASGIMATIYARPYTNVNNRSVLCTNALYHNFTGSPSGVFDFPIATVLLGRNSSEDDVEIIDTRTRGGGISRDGIINLDKVVNLQPEAKFFWDNGYFDGEAIPGNGVVVVDISKRILTNHGGSITEDEVRQKVLKHLALGSYPLLNFI